MKEKLKQFVGAKRGVSPVIGVVLMVAVVVILAAVIGAFVLGLGGNQQSTPQASFSLDNGQLVFENGDTLQADNIKVTNTGAGTDGSTGDVGVDATGEITAGTVVATPTNAGTVRVIYTGDGKSTAIWKSDFEGTSTGG